MQVRFFPCAWPRRAPGRRARACPRSALRQPVAGDAGREGHEDLLVLVHEEAAGQRTLQSRQDLLAFVDRRLRQQHDELLAAVARDPVGRPQRLADDRGERLQRLVAGAVAELVVETLEIVDVEQADRPAAGRSARAARARSRTPASARGDSRSG